MIIFNNYQKMKNRKKMLVQFVNRVLRFMISHYKISYYQVIFFINFIVIVFKNKYKSSIDDAVC